MSWTATLTALITSPTISTAPCSPCNTIRARATAAIIRQAMLPLSAWKNTPSHGIPRGTRTASTFYRALSEPRAGRTKLPVLPSAWLSRAHRLRHGVWILLAVSKSYGPKPAGLRHGERLVALHRPHCAAPVPVLGSAPEAAGYSGDLLCLVCRVLPRRGASDLGTRGKSARSTSNSSLL